MDEKAIMDDFADRCVKLTLLLKILRANERSPRVWTATLIEFLRDISNEQKDPQAALEQIIKVLKMKKRTI